MRKPSCTSHVALIAAIVFACAHLPGSSRASRPFVTEDAGVAGKGIVQFEWSWDYLKWRNNDREHAIMLVPVIGISDEVELSFEAPLFFHNHVANDGASGIGDINVVSKYLLAHESEILPALALKTVVKTTTGNVKQGLGTGAVDYSMVTVASKQAGDLTLHAMFGYTFIGTNGNTNLRDIFLHGVAAEYALTDDLRLVGEYAGSRHPDRMVDEHPGAAMFGAVFALTDASLVDVSLRFGTNSIAPDWNTSVGLTVSL
jgi:hypothetical protein